jgi:hypothetical protein
MNFNVFLSYLIFINCFFLIKEAIKRDIYAHSKIYCKIIKKRKKLCTNPFSKFMFYKADLLRFRPAINTFHRGSYYWVAFELLAVVRLHEMPAIEHLKQMLFRPDCNERNGLCEKSMPFFYLRIFLCL